MSIELEKIAKHFCPSDNPEDPAFPNHSDEDIWIVAFKTAVILTTKIFVGEFTNTTEKWIINKFKEKHPIK